MSAFFYGRSKTATKGKNMERCLSRNLEGKIFESNNRFRIYNAGQHYNFSTITNISELHHPFHTLDDLTVGAAVVAAVPALNTRGTYGRNP